jgi:hypothetical protein
MVKRMPFPPRTNTGPRQIIGLRLPLDMAKEVKAEAVQRRVSLKTLFSEIWLGYKKNMSFPPSETFTGARQMVGFSLPRDLATEIKGEAARRKIAVTRLFVGLWLLYRKSTKGS